MNTQSNAMPGSSLDSQGIAPAVMSATQPLYWSVRRELWENRSIYIAPLGAATVSLLGFLISLVHLPGKIRVLSGLDPAKQAAAIRQPYQWAALLIMGAAFLVAIFYCLEALHGERRDRSILFWKSLPVSDLTTVLSKASIPIVVLPLLAFVITLAVQWLMLLLSSIVVLASGLPVKTMWAQLSWFRMSMMLFCHLLFLHGLWYAPFYAWLLLVSAWARRAPFLWAFLPLFAIGMVEKIAFNTSHFAGMLGLRLQGGDDVFPFPMPGSMPMDPMTMVAAERFLFGPGLWIGLAVAAAFLAAAIRLRRHQGPI